jgi:hypothetical protein
MFENTKVLYVVALVNNLDYSVIFGSQLPRCKLSLPVSNLILRH